MHSAKKTTPRPSIESVRNFWDSRPCNVRHSQQPMGTKAYFDEVEKRKYFVEPHIPRFAQFERWNGKYVLEVGCGMGTDAVNFARAGANYHGIDLSKESIKLAQKRFEIFKLQGSIQNVNAETLSENFPANSCDLVYSFGVIHHTPHPDAVIREIRKVIHPNGELRIMLYARHSWKAIMIDAGLDQPEAQFGVPIADTFSEEEVYQLLEPNGFKIMQTTQDHIFPYVVEKYIQFQYEVEPWFKAMPKAMFAALEGSLGWHMLVVAAPQ